MCLNANAILVEIKYNKSHNHRSADLYLPFSNPQIEKHTNEKLSFSYLLYIYWNKMSMIHSVVSCHITSSSFSNDKIKKINHVTLDFCSRRTCFEFFDTIDNVFRNCCSIPNIIKKNGWFAWNSGKIHWYESCKTLKNHRITWKSKTSIRSVKSLNTYCSMARMFPIFHWSWLCPHRTFQLYQANRTGQCFE